MTVYVLLYNFACNMMRKVIFILLAIIGAAQCIAQSFSPTTNWPYLLDDFKEGVIFLDNGMTTESTRLNIHLDGNKLQCVNSEGVISRVILGNIDRIEIDGRMFRFVDGKLMECLHKEDGCMIVRHEKADFEEMLKIRTPYGIDGRTSWSTIIYALGLKGVSNEKYDDIRPTWYDGSEIQMLRSDFFAIKGKVFPATMKGCSNVLEPALRKELKALVKEKKTDWRKTEDLKVVMRYMKEHL